MNYKLITTLLYVSSDERFHPTEYSSLVILPSGWFNEAHSLVEHKLSTIIVLNTYIGLQYKKLKS